MTRRLELLDRLPSEPSRAKRTAFIPSDGCESLQRIQSSNFPPLGNLSESLARDGAALVTVLTRAIIMDFLYNSSHASTCLCWPTVVEKMVIAVKPPGEKVLLCK